MAEPDSCPDQDQDQDQCTIVCEATVRTMGPKRGCLLNGRCMLNGQRLQSDGNSISLPWNLLVPVPLGPINLVP